MAPVQVYAFNNVMLVVNREELSDREVVDLVAVTAKDTKSIHQGIYTKMHIAGNGYKVQLPTAADAGFDVGDVAPVFPAPNLLVITDGSTDGARLAEDLVSLRRDQRNSV